MANSNTFQSMNPNYKESYAGSKKKDRFKRVKSILQPKGKATAEVEASKDPEKWMKTHKNMKIPKKGIAF